MCSIEAHTRWSCSTQRAMSSTRGATDNFPIHMVCRSAPMATSTALTTPTTRCANTPPDIAVGVAILSPGNMYVADGYSNARVHKYDPDGRLLLSWGESGTDPGQFNIVHNVVVDREGFVYVADRENQRVQVFDADGKFETQWNDMSRVAAICMDDSDDQLVYLGEYFCGIGSNEMGTNLGPRVSIMNRQGEVLARLGNLSYGEEPGRFYSPHGIAVDSKGDIYVAEVSWSDYGTNLEPPRELRSMQKLIKKYGVRIAEDGPHRG